MRATLQFNVAKLASIGVPMHTFFDVKTNVLTVDLDCDSKALFNPDACRSLRECLGDPMADALINQWQHEALVAMATVAMLGKQFPEE